MALIGAWDEVLRCTLGFARRLFLLVLNPWRLIGQNQCACAVEVSFVYLPQSSAAVSLKPDTLQCCVSWFAACHEKERGAGRQMLGVAWSQVSPRSMAANRISDLQRHSSPATRNAAKTTDRSCCDFCCAHSPYGREEVFHNRLSSRESFVQIRLLR